MNLRDALVFASLALAPAVTGCAPKAVIPPTNTAAFLETPATLGAGNQSVEATVASSSGGFGPGVAAGTFAYMRGITDRVDVGVAPTIQSFGSARGRIDGFQDGDGYAYGADARAKVNPFDSRHVALFGSVGGATNRYATFASASLGVSIGYENAYVVPFVDLVAYGSVPLVREAFTYRSEPTATPRTLTPTSTHGGIVSAGLAVKATNAVSIKAAVHRAEVHSETDALATLGAAASLDVTF